MICTPKAHITNIIEPDYPLFILVSILIITSIVFSYSLTVYTIEFFDYNQLASAINAIKQIVNSFATDWKFKDTLVSGSFESGQ